MVKTINFMLLLSTWLCSQNLDYGQLQRDCLQCHEQQSIPSELIYRRYLATYSIAEKMEPAIIAYLKSPQQNHSIMPSQFFLKFPMKEKIVLEDEILKADIKAFINYFDIKKKLMLSK